MTPIENIRLTIELGSRRQRVALDELGPGVDPVQLRAACLRALLRPRPPLPVSEEGGRGKEAPNEEGNEIVCMSSERYLNSFPFSLHSPGDEGSRGEEGRRALDAAIEFVATTLAVALHDPRSRAFHRVVAERVPLGAVRQCLGLAQGLAPHEVRRSRAAYFTALVRPHLADFRRRS
jgi:hypothetical protein